MKQILTILLLFATTTLLVQTLYTRKDTIAITSDSVILQVGQVLGKPVLHGLINIVPKIEPV